MTQPILESTKNTRAVERRALKAARGILHRRNLHAFFEHGHWWIEDLRTGAQYDVVDTDAGFDLEQVMAPQE